MHGREETGRGSGCACRLSVGRRWVSYDMGEVPSGHVNGWLATSKRKARGFVVPVLGYMGHRPWVKIAIWA